MKLIRLREVIKKTALSRSSIYRLISNNKFPTPVHLSQRSTAWVEQEVDDWILDRISVRSEGQHLKTQPNNNNQL